MSDTPQTDNAPKFYFGDNRPSMETECVSANFARSLERQRDALLEALRGMMSAFDFLPVEVSEVCPEEWDRAEAAIAKVKGAESAINQEVKP